MAGFLDKDTRVLDMVLTGLGKSLLSRGNLQFVYWVPYDDEVDYDPVLMNSGSLTATQLSASVNLSIQTTPVREACAGYKIMNASGSDNVNVNKSVFTMGAGQRNVPRASFPDLSDPTIRVGQRPVKRDSGLVGEQLGAPDTHLGFEFVPTSAVQIQLGYEKNSFPPGYKLQGFKVELFLSGSDGFVEQPVNRDASNNVALGKDVRVSVVNGKRELHELFVGREHLFKRQG